jgi:hypothetical protein
MPLRSAEIWQVPGKFIEMIGAQLSKFTVTRYAETKISNRSAHSTTNNARISLKQAALLSACLGNWDDTIFNSTTFLAFGTSRIGSDNCQ